MILIQQNIQTFLIHYRHPILQKNFNKNMHLLKDLTSYLDLQVRFFFLKKKWTVIVGNTNLFIPFQSANKILNVL